MPAVSKSTKTMMRTNTAKQLATFVAICLCVQTSARADLIETATNRYVVVVSQGGSVVDGPNEQDDSNMYGPADQYVESFAWETTHGGSSQASQDSDVSHGQYQVDMWVRTDAGGGTMGVDIATGYAESSFEVLFTLTEATDFNVSGSYNAFGFVNGAVSEAEVRIDNVGGTGTPSQVIAFTNDNCCPSVNIDGMLLPGDYAFRVNTLAIVDHSFMMSYTDSNAATDVVMTLDVPQENPLGDMDCSGTVDIDDVAPFVSALVDPSDYNAMFPDCNIDLADMNADTLRDGRDLHDFVATLVAP